MNSKPTTLLAALLLSCLALAATEAQAQAKGKAFSLSSPDLAKGMFDNKFILNGFGCKGENVSPALEWKNVPVGTKSLSLQIHDPDHNPSYPRLPRPRVFCTGLHRPGPHIV